MTPADLKAWRTAMGWTQDDIAEALSADPEQPKVTRVTIGRWERGESTPPPYLRLALERLAGPASLRGAFEAGWEWAMDQHSEDVTLDAAFDRWARGHPTTPTESAVENDSNEPPLTP